MTNAPILNLSTGDYLADTMHLDSPALHGAYLLILISSWRTNDGKLPNDLGHLARVCRCPKWQFENRIWPKISSLFASDETHIWQDRLHRSRLAVRDSVEAKRTAGSLGGRAKALNNKKRGLAHASGLLQQNVADGGGNQTKEKESPPIVPPKGANGHFLSPDWLPGESDVLFATEQGLPETDIETIAANFRDYWNGATGAKARKRDWSATWRVWVRREAERRQPVKPQGTQWN